MLLLAVAGCPPPPKPPPRALGEIIASIEGNAAKLDAPLWSNDVQVKARVTDDEGREHVQNLDGRMLFEKPRRLFMQLSPPIGEPIMEIGSNDSEFWVWIEADINRMWWGKYRHLGKPCAERIIVRPDELLTAIGIGGLPKDARLVGPAPKQGNVHDILIYLRERPDGGWTLDEYKIDRKPPHQIVGMISRDTSGEIAMSAFLTDYRQAWKDGPYIPGAINVRWHKSDDTFTLWINSAEAADKVSPIAFVRPVGSKLPKDIRNRVEQIDDDCDMLDVAEQNAPSGAAKAPDLPSGDSQE